jgi:hypothetical protein
VSVPRNIRISPATDQKAKRMKMKMQQKLNENQKQSACAWCACCLGATHQTTPHTLRRPHPCAGSTLCTLPAGPTHGGPHQPKPLWPLVSRRRRRYITTRASAPATP